MTQVQPAPTTDEVFVRFPPFPPPPPGVKIIPFKEYEKKETGIKLTCPNKDGIEVDGLDIPTVALDKKHTTDRCKTDAWRDYKDIQDGPKPPKKRKVKTYSANGQKKEWWEIWAEEEAGKFTGPYAKKTPPIDRLVKAAEDFRTSRAWPEVVPRQLSAARLFDQFGIFIGLKAIVPHWIRAETRRAKEAFDKIKELIEEPGQNPPQNDVNDEDSDDCEEGFYNKDVSVSGSVAQDEAQNDPVVEATEEKVKTEAEEAAIEEENKRKDERLLAFLNDPETVVKMFLSSYFRKEGLVWTDSNLFITPRVLFFFFRYILRNKLLPAHEVGLKNALAIVERAQVELPRTSIVAKMIPCEVSLALRDQFGSKAEQFNHAVEEEEETKKAEPEQQTKDNDVDMGDNADLEESTAEYVGGGEYDDVVQPILRSDGIARIEEIDGEADDALDSKGPNQKPEPETSGDMDVDPASGNGDEDGEGGSAWATGLWDPEGAWKDASALMAPEPNVDWTLPVYSLKHLLGVDALPETYTTGVVEESVRKIVAVYAPDGKATDASQGIEGEFERKLGRIVLEPWNDWDVPKEGEELDEIRRVYSEIYRGKRINKGIRKLKEVERATGPGAEEITKKSEENASGDQNEKAKINPEDWYDDEGQDYTESAGAKIVWETSRGWVVDPTVGSEEGEGLVLYSNCTPQKPQPDSASAEVEGKPRKAHDPLKDAVEILVDPAVIEKVKDVIGMGFGGTFVQLVPGDSSEDSVKRFWYLEDLKLVIPSFYTA